MPLGRLFMLEAAGLGASGWVGSGVPDGQCPRDQRYLGEERASGAPTKSTRREILTLLSRSGLALDDLLRLAELNNPRLRAARANVLVVAGRARQSSQYPNPELALELEEVPSSRPGVGARFGARAAPESEVIRTQVEVHRLRLAAGQLRERQLAALGRLASLLGGITIPLDRIPGALDSDPPDPRGAAFASRLIEEHPAVGAARRMLRAAGQRVVQVKAERFPDIKVGLTVGRNGKEDETFREGALSIPLPILDRNQGRNRRPRQQGRRHVRPSTQSGSISMPNSPPRWRVTARRGFRSRHSRHRYYLPPCGRWHRIRTDTAPDGSPCSICSMRSEHWPQLACPCSRGFGMQG